MYVDVLKGTEMYVYMYVYLRKYHILMATINFLSVLCALMNNNNNSRVKITKRFDATWTWACLVSYNKSYNGILIL